MRLGFTMVVRGEGNTWEREDVDRKLDAWQVVIKSKPTLALFSHFFFLSFFLSILSFSSHNLYANDTKTPNPSQNPNLNPSRNQLTSSIHDMTSSLPPSLLPFIPPQPPGNLLFIFLLLLIFLFLFLLISFP